MPRYQWLDLITTAASSHSGAFGWLMQIASLLGKPLVTGWLISLLALTAYMYGHSQAMLGFVLCLTTLMLSMSLKPLFRRPRPATSHIKTYSFPSGHAMGTVVAYGYMMAQGFVLLPGFMAWTFAVFAICFVLATGYSRVYLGEHYPSDVLGGWFFGLIALVSITFLTIN